MTTIETTNALATIQKEFDQTVKSKIPDKISSMDEYRVATDCASIYKQRIKRVETTVDYLVDPLKQQIKEIKSFFSPFLIEAETVLQIIKEKMIPFIEAEQKRADAEQKAIEKAAMKNTQSKEVSVPVVNEIRTQRGDMGTSTMRKIPRYRVIDAAKVPKKYMMLNDEAVKAAQKMNVKIPGIEYYFDSSITIRT